MKSDFSYSDLFQPGALPPSPPFAGLPKYVFNSGHNDPEMVPTEALAAATASVLEREGSKLAIYNMGQGPLGYRGLRQFIAAKLSTTRGIAESPDNILITSGSNPAIDLICELFLQRGDTVLVEAFSYQGALGRFTRHGAKMVPVAMDSEGLLPDALETVLADCASQGIRPKFLYTIPTIQNPTGAILGLPRRQQILQIAERHGLLIFEDECYADLAWRTDLPPAFYALAPSRVVHVGSFSKSLAPAIRLGYVAASWDVLSRLIPFKRDGGTGALDQLIAAEFCSRHFFDHVQALKTHLHAKMELMVEVLHQEFGSGAEFIKPEGGIYIWVKLPEHVDTTKLIAPAAKAGIAFNTGPEWACSKDDAKHFMRLCFAYPSADEIRAGVAELARICHEETGIPKFKANVERGGSADIARSGTNA